MVLPVLSSFIASSRRSVASRRALASFSSVGTRIRQELFPDEPLVGQNVDAAIGSLWSADCVCFDVDSTVVNEEGIDVLADFLGQGEQVAAVTRQAMEGGMKFQDALKLRLNLLQPSLQQIQDCLEKHPLQLTTGVGDLVRAMQLADKHVWLVSGGFRLMIEPVADKLDIPTTRIVANTLLFDDQGRYRDFDATEPTSQDMGKPRALQDIISPHYKNIVMIGDGATDAQAKPPAAAFVGFGGVVTRQAVKDVADWFVTDFRLLRSVVEYQE